MNTHIRTGIVLLLAALTLAACSGSPDSQRDPYNSPDSQRTRAGQAQDELSRDTSR